MHSDADIKFNNARPNAILINCPIAVAAAATAIVLSGYFVFVVLTDCSVPITLSYCARSVPLLNLLNNCFNQPVLSIILF